MPTAEEMHNSLIKLLSFIIIIIIEMLQNRSPAFPLASTCVSIYKKIMARHKKDKQQGSI